MKELTMTRMDGAGNTFLIFNLYPQENMDLFDRIFSGQSRADIARQLCRPKQGEATDGLVLLLPPEPDTNVDFRWDFYNADGSVAEMCGNAARCVANYAFKNGLTKATIRFTTLAGVISAKVKSNNHVEIQLTQISNPTWHKKVDTPLGNFTCDLIDSGVPHAVITVDSPLELETLRPVAVELRKSQYFPPRGANITFLYKQERQSIQSVSFERGVENFTLACGTGAVAAALSSIGVDGLIGSHTIPVKVPGGQLSVRFDQGLPFLYGPTQFLKETVLK